MCFFHGDDGHEQYNRYSTNNHFSMIAFEVKTIWVIFTLARIMLKRGTLIIGGLMKCTVRIYL